MNTNGTAIDWDQLTKKVLELKKLHEGYEKEERLLEIVNILYPSDFYQQDDRRSLPPFLKKVHSRFKKLPTPESRLYDGYDLLGNAQLALYEFIPLYDDSLGVPLENYLIDKCAWSINNGYREDKEKNVVPLDPDDRLSADSDTADSSVGSMIDPLVLREAICQAVLKVFPEAFFSQRDRLLIELLIQSIYSKGRYRRYFHKRFGRNTWDDVHDIEILVNEVLNIICASDRRNADEYEMYETIAESLPEELKNAGYEVNSDTCSPEYIYAGLLRIQRRYERIGHLRSSAGGFYA